VATTEFRQRVRKSLADGQARGNIRRAMNGLMVKRLEALPDPDAREALRARCAALKAGVLADLPDLLEQLEHRCRANGVQVHWAETTDDANRTCHQILAARGARTLVKGKSMVSEEMGLNRYLETRGVEVLESDLGEFILQLAEEPPSHIIAPAIHKNRYDVAALFREKFPDIPYTEDIDQLCANAREILRRKFYAADAGSRASTSRWPRPAPCAWWKTRATAACAPRCRRCTSRSWASRRWWRGWSTSRRC